MALRDKSLVACAKWAQTVANEAPETPNHEGRRLLASAVVGGRYDDRVKDYCVAFWADDDTTDQATVDAHAVLVLEVFQKLGLS